MFLLCEFFSLRLPWNYFQVFSPILGAYFCVCLQMVYLRFFTTNFSFYLMTPSDQRNEMTCLSCDSNRVAPYWDLWRMLFRLRYSTVAGYYFQGLLKPLVQRRGWWWPRCRAGFAENPESISCPARRGEKESGWKSRIRKVKFYATTMPGASPRQGTRSFSSSLRYPVSSHWSFSFISMQTGFQWLELGSQVCFTTDHF